MSSFKSPISLTSTGGVGSIHRALGEVHVIVGPMFAGKTTALLRRIKSESNNGRNVAMIKSSKDTRYATDSIVTHDGVKFPCWALPDLSSFRQKFGAEAYEKLEVIGIDEAQFFEDLYDFCCEVADHDGKTVIVAGLDGDYLRRSFGSVLDVIPLADSVTKLTARCELCGKRAFFTLRKIERCRQNLLVVLTSTCLSVASTMSMDKQLLKLQGMSWSLVKIKFRLTHIRRQLQLSNRAMLFLQSFFLSFFSAFHCSPV
ncbi:hypothetical protein PVL29_015634 [Vitis rotundifolia]|uniref:Thymidine kinase n=1 Tax=Vitis rotundifolia TaxID=103349 RepID=A0AA38ZEE6_VITRO|nr:hypothetical protein PVL29_015634 [Vitis rotundifolia]